MRPIRTVHAERIVNASRVFDQKDFSLLEEDFSKTLTSSSILLPGFSKKKGKSSFAPPVIHLFTDGSLLIKKNTRQRSDGGCPSYLILSDEDELYEFISDLYENDRGFLELLTKTLHEMSSMIIDNDTINTLTTSQSKKVVSSIFNECSTMANHT